MTGDPRQIVAEGYDAAAGEYARWLETSVVDPGRERYRDAFCHRLPRGARILELGCGGGGPTTRYLAARFDLTGIDASATQVAMAREFVPSATFLPGDMTRFEFDAHSFDGVAAFYSLIHLPYGELPAMLVRISGWLRPGGVLVATLSARDSGEHFEPAWLAGVPMYWGGHSPGENLAFLAAAGLHVLESSIEHCIEDGEPQPQLWVLASKPSAAS